MNQTSLALLYFFPFRTVNRHSECALGANVVAMIWKTKLSEYLGEDYHVDDISDDDDDGANYGLTITYHIWTYISTSHQVDAGF